jgi:hypothetical protein
MGIPREGRNGSVKLDREGLIAWLDRLGRLEDRIQRQIELTSTSGMYTLVGNDRRLSAAVELRDQHVKALLGALKAVRKVIHELKQLRDATNKAGGYVVAADRDSADDMPGGGN